MAKKGTSRRYFGRRRRGGSGKVTIPIMGVATAAALAGGILTNKAGTPDSVIGYIGKGSPTSAALVGMKAVGRADSYVPMLVPAAIWIVGRVLLGKKKITKRVSVF